MNVMKLSNVKWSRSYGWVNEIVSKYSIYVTSSMTGYQQDVSKIWNVQQVHFLQKMAFHSSYQKQLVLTSQCYNIMQTKNFCVFANFGLIHMLCNLTFGTCHDLSPSLS